MEVHHTHVLACTFPARLPILEVYYENGWLGTPGGRPHWDRADLWAPPNDHERQIYVEVKRARLYDRTSAQIGGPRYNLQQATAEWAGDIWRLLVGPANPTCCGFLLCVYSNDGTDLFSNWNRPVNPIVPLATNQVNADDDQRPDNIYAMIVELGNSPTAVGAIDGLADIVEDQLKGQVIRLSGNCVVATRSDGTQLAADPLLFTWEQEGAQHSTCRRHPRPS